MVVRFLLVVMLVHLLVSAHVSFFPDEGLEFGILTAISENRTLPVHMYNNGPEDFKLASIVPKETDNGLIVNMTDDRIIKFGDDQILVAQVTCIALTPGRKTGTLIITTNSSNGTASIHEMTYSLSVLHGGIGFERTQFIFYIPIKNTTCNEEASNPLLTRQVYFTNYFQVPISLQMISSATCGDLIHIDPSSIPQGAVNSLEKWSAINVTYDVNLASRKSNELLPFTCWLEVWTTISSHRIPIHLIDGALKLAFIDAQMVDEPGSMSSAGLDFIKGDKHTKLCGQSAESQIESNSDIYNIRMQTQSRDEPKPLRLAFTNKNPTKFDLSIVKASCDLCLCFESSWADDDDDSALYYMSRVADLSLQDAHSDNSGRCSCTPSDKKLKNSNSSSNYITKLKIGHTSLFSVIFSGKSTFMGSNIIAFTLGSLNQRIHAIIHLDFINSKLISSMKSSQREVFIGMESNTLVKTVIPSSMEQSMNNLVTKTTSADTIVTDSFVDHHNRIMLTSLAPNISCFRLDQLTSNIWSCTQELLEKHCGNIYPNEYCNPMVKRLQSISGYMESKQIAKFLRDRNALLAYDTSLLDIQITSDVSDLLVYSSFSLHRYPIPAILTKSPIKYIPILSSAKLPIISIDEIAVFYIQLYNPFARALTFLLKDYTIMPSAQSEQSIVSAITMMPSLWDSAFSDIVKSFDGIVLNATYTESLLAQNDQVKPDLNNFRGILYQKYSLSSAQFHQIRSNIATGTSAITPFIVNSIAMNDIVVAPRSSATTGPFAFVPNIVLYRNKLANGGIVTPDEHSEPIIKLLDGTPSFVCHSLNFHLVNNFTGADMIEISGESGTANLVMKSALIINETDDSQIEESDVHKVSNKNYVYLKIGSNKAEALFSVLNNGSISAIIEDVVVNGRGNYSCIQNSFQKYAHYILSPTFDLKRNDILCSLSKTFPIRINSNDIFNLTLPLPQSKCKYYEIHDNINIVTSMGIALEFVVVSHFSKKITDSCYENIGFNVKSFDPTKPFLYIVLSFIALLSFIQLKLLTPHLVFKSNVLVNETTVTTKSKQVKKKKKEIVKENLDEAKISLNLEKSLISNSDEQDNIVPKISYFNSSLDDVLSDNTTQTASDSTILTNLNSDDVSTAELSQPQISIEPPAKIDNTATSNSNSLLKIAPITNAHVKIVHDKRPTESNSKGVSSLMMQEQKWSPTRIFPPRQESVQYTKSASIPKGNTWARLGPKESQAKESQAKESQPKETEKNVKYTLLSRTKPQSTIVDNKATHGTTLSLLDESSHASRGLLQPTYDSNQNPSHTFNTSQYSSNSKDITRNSEALTNKVNGGKFSGTNNSANNTFARFPTLSHSDNIITLAPPPGLSLPPGFDVPQSQTISPHQDNLFNVFTGGTNTLNFDNNLQHFNQVSLPTQMNNKNDLLNINSFASIDGHLESWMDELLED